MPRTPSMSRMPGDATVHYRVNVECDPARRAEVEAVLPFTVVRSELRPIGWVRLFSEWLPGATPAPEALATLRQLSGQGLLAASGWVTVPEGVIDADVAYPAVFPKTEAQD